MNKKDVVHTYKGILLSHKNKTMPLTAMWMDLQITMLSEISQRKTYII